MAPPKWSDTQIINQLDTGAHWSTASVSFGFLTTAPDWSGSSGDTFSALNREQKAAARFAMELWDDVIATDFSEAANGDTATIKLANTETDIRYGKASYPGTSDEAGSVWFNSAEPDISSPEIGEWGFRIFLHEIGHAIGLAHPGEYDGGSPTYQADAEYAQDSQMYTVMSYFPSYETGADWTGADGIRNHTQTPMLHDIMTAQAIYGAETATRTGDTVYGFKSTADRWIYDFSKNPEPVLTIWDAGGKDTLDLSGWDTTSRVNLNPGSFSDVGGMSNNIAVAHGTWIEKAVGGEGEDTLVGNKLRNQLAGNDGDDVISGLSGTDKLIGGGGNDILKGGGGKDSLIAGSGRDVLIGGPGADAFFYTASKDIGTGAARDTIRDFLAGSDILDLARIDANASVGGNQAFDFIGRAEFSAAGQLRYDSGVLSGDLDGDGLADFGMKFANSVLLESSDVLL